MRQALPTSAPAHRPVLKLPTETVPAETSSMLYPAASIAVSYVSPRPHPFLAEPFITLRTNPSLRPQCRPDLQSSAQSLLSTCIITIQSCSNTVDASQGVSLYDAYCSSYSNALPSTTSGRSTVLVTETSAAAGAACESHRPILLGLLPDWRSRPCCSAMEGLRVF